MTLTNVSIEEIRFDELPFKKNRYSGDNDKPSFKVVIGKIPIIISSPHSVKTTEKVMATRDIIKAIDLAKKDEDDILNKIITQEIITSPEDLDINAILINGEKKKIEFIAEDFGLNPHVLTYYYYKTADEEEKLDEPYTGAYALYLAKVLNCFAYVRNNNLEANAAVDHQNPQFIKFLKDNNILLHMDLHGAKHFEDAHKNDFDIAFGTNHGEYIREYISFQNIARSSYIPYGIINLKFNTKFQASKKRALCNQVYRYAGIQTSYGIQTFQAEVNGIFRRPVSEEEKARMFLGGSIDFLGNLMDEEKGRIYGKTPRH